MKVDGREQSRALREKNYKACVFIRGCMEQKLYSTNLDSVRKRAIKLLTAHAPGFGNTVPVGVNLYEKIREISGNRSEWKAIEVIPYNTLSDDQLEFKKVWNASS